MANVSLDIKLEWKKNFFHIFIDEVKHHRVANSYCGRKSARVNISLSTSILYAKPSINEMNNPNDLV